MWRFASQLKVFKLGQLGTTHVLSVFMTTRRDPIQSCSIYLNLLGLLCQLYQASVEGCLLKDGFRQASTVFKHGCLETHSQTEMGGRSVEIHLFVVTTSKALVTSSVALVTSSEPCYY